MTSDDLVQRSRVPVVSGPVIRKAEPAKLRYDGRTGRVAAIVLINGLLNFPTLGFYRFWGKTRLRRYIWGRISFLDEPLEYTGAAKELLLGFLVALFILLPLFLVPVGFAFFYSTPEIQGVVEMVQAVILIFLINVAIFRARRYRLSRSQWRGIRGGQSGKATVYALKALAWGFFMLITVGLGYALYRTRLQRYLTENTWFGDRNFSFEGKASKLFWLWFLAWLLLIPTLGLSYVWYRVREFRYFTSVTRLGAIEFRSRLEAGTAILLVIAYGLVLSMVLGLVGALLVKAFSAGLLGSFDEQALAEASTQILSPINISVVAFSLVFIVFYGMVRMIVLVHPMLGAICRTLDVRGEEDIANIRQSELTRPGRGEGLADGLDIGDF